MLKALCVLLSVCFASNIGASSYQVMRHKVSLKKEVVGYKPYAKTLNEKQLKCLTDNIYFEAGDQKETGKKAVALVTLNRLKNDIFPNTICAIVYQRNRYKCQFSWTCNPNRKIKYWNAYLESKKIAEYILVNHEHIDDVTMGATFFHRDDIKKPWSNKKIKPTVSIGRHIFYKL